MTLSPLSTATLAAAAILSLPVSFHGDGQMAAHRAAEQDADQAADEEDCDVDLTRPGQMSDILSNALMGSLGKPEASVIAFLGKAQEEAATGEELLRVTAAHFQVDEAVMRREVEAYRHVNCSHRGGGRAGTTEKSDAPTGGEPIKVSTFARDVTLHVVLHELGHALVREFDLPILGNEETLADAFATCYLTAHMPDRALDVLLARTQSLMFEAREVPRAEWTVRGEHNSDARRAYQIAALAMAADAERYLPVAKAAGMSNSDISRARDYGTEIHRSWRRILRPVWMPEGLRSREARVVNSGDEPFGRQVAEMGLVAEIDAVLRRFDWHSQVKVVFEDSEGGAGWNRSRRTVTVHSEYVYRFVKQGEQIAAAESKR